MSKQKKITLDEILDILPLGPKNQLFWDRKAERVARRIERLEAEELAEERKLARVWPDYIQIILKRRLQLRMTQKELARRLRTNQAVISKLERGEGNHTLTFLGRVCTELDLKLTVTIK